jgi:hypothetical protein
MVAAVNVFVKSARIDVPLHQHGICCQGVGWSKRSGLKTRWAPSEEMMSLRLAAVPLSVCRAQAAALSIVTGPLGASSLKA